MSKSEIEALEYWIGNLETRIQQNEITITLLCRLLKIESKLELLEEHGEVKVER